MTQIPLPAFLDDRHLPLPIEVAQRWNFPLLTIEHKRQTLFRLHDWLTGLVDEKYAGQKIRDYRRPGELFDQHVGSTHTLIEYDSKHREQNFEYVTDRLLYLAVMDIRLTKKRKESTPVSAIKHYLAVSGAFVDLIRRKPETVVTSGLIDPETAFEAGVNEYRKLGKPDSWIAIRLEGKIKREMFISALNAAVTEYLNESHYRIATDDIYLGLWKRTAAQLKSELGLSKRTSLRDNQPNLALAYQGIAEEISAQKLGDKRMLSWYQARIIVQKVAEFIGAQAQQTSRFLKTDLATGKPLLAAGR